MQQITFQTNLKCAGCEATVRPYIDAIPGVHSWKVDLLNPQKLLTVEGEKIDMDAVKTAIEKAGFKAIIV